MRLTNARVPDRHPAWSTDGARLAWDTGKPGARSIVVADAQPGATATSVTDAAGDDAEPTWSPDGARIAFTSNRSGGRSLWSVDLQGLQTTRIANFPGIVQAPAWSPGGRAIAVAVGTGSTSHVWRIDVATGKRSRLTRGAGARSAPDWAPNGRFLAYGHRRGLDWSLRIVRSTGGAERLLPGTVGYGDPDWSLAGGLLKANREQLPDLDQRAPYEVQVVRVDGSWRVGFASATENVGDGPLWLRGVRDGRARLRTDQVITLRGGGRRIVRRVGKMLYEFHAPHFHWHLQDFVRYELRAADTHRLVKRDRKTGFCLIDRWGRALTKVPGVPPPRFTSNCGERNRQVRVVEQGTSRGYSDIYPAFYHGQDIDLTGIPDGRYVLVQRVNATRRMGELRYGNNTASVVVTITHPAGATGRPRLRVVKRCEHTEFCAGPPKAG
ncbi:MAG: lysyl oxidase family protein [Thermoleophilia bacterium]